MANKLNSMRFLEAHNAAYQAFTYEQGFHEAAEVAALIGVPVEQVYKTLVVERGTGGKPVLIMIAANRQLDLKRLAAAIGQKKVNMASHDAAEHLTGLKVGGIGALALTAKNWDVYLDQPALALEYIYVSAGQRGVNLRVAVKDLIRVLNAKVVAATSAELPATE
jgi:Cys-tRNA(Pro)/Cys-tRNA(Cys) deacylase